MNKLQPLIALDVVHRRRYLVVWLALTFAAGSTNATALLACQSFVTHVTGSLTRAGVDVEQPTLLFEYLAVVLCFIAGAMTSVLLLDVRRLRGLDPWPVLPIFLVAALTAAAGFAGISGVFGPFGRTIETPGDFLLLSILGFAMGLQNAAVATATGMVVRTTHMTGPVTDFSVALATYWFSPVASVRAAAHSSVRLRGAKIVAFIVGAAAAEPVAVRIQYAAFFVPAIVTLGAAIAFHRLLRSDNGTA